MIFYLYTQFCIGLIAILALDIFVFNETIDKSLFINKIIIAIFVSLFLNFNQIWQLYKLKQSNQ